jgi:hypothetical protein
MLIFINSMVHSLNKMIYIELPINDCSSGKRFDLDDVLKVDQDVLCLFRKSFHQ